MSQPDTVYRSCDIKPIIGLMVVIAGMVGLYFDVQYSGWVLFVGCMAVAT